MWIITEIWQLHNREVKKMELRIQKGKKMTSESLNEIIGARNKGNKKIYKKKFIFNGTKYCLYFQIYNYQVLKKFSFSRITKYNIYRLQRKINNPKIDVSLILEKN